MINRTSLVRVRESLRDGVTGFLLAMTLLSLVGGTMPAMDLARLRPAVAGSGGQADWREPLPSEQKVIHLLSRITFGARPGDVERVRKMGLAAFLDEQLHPERIEDSVVEAKLGALPTLSMSSDQLLEKYGPPFQAQKRAQLAAQKGQPTPAQPPSNASGLPPKDPGTRPAMAMATMEAMQGPQRILVELAQQELWRAVYSNRQLQEVMVQFWMNHFNIFAPKGADRWLLTSFERDAIRPHALGKFEDLLVATAESPAMLFYLDNWMSATPNPTYPGNFNGRAGKPGPKWGRNAGMGAGPMGGFGRRRLRRWPLGQLPQANPRLNPSQAPRPAQAAAQRPGQRRGLNENYARELMELHTLGVDGGFTQRDVIEVARCFTGWTIDRPQQGGGFIFRPQIHDFGEKVVLGRRIRSGGGAKDGLEVLHRLGRHPSTAHFISLKLCRRFIADDPPESAVQRATQTFQRTGGDIRAVLKTILSSPEFYSQAAFRAKVKSPFELVASSVRALGGDVDLSPPLLFGMARMGQPMFQYEAPTGFPDRAATWINSGALLARINFAMQLAASRVPGTQVDLKPFEAEEVALDRLLDEMSVRLTGGTLSPATRKAILDQLANSTDRAARMDTNREAATLAGLVLASPEFQRR